MPNPPLLQTGPGKLPNFFLLGAGRCGTTSLYHGLRQHPEIFMSPVKEPSFFCEPFQVIKSPVQYVKLFAGAGREPAVGEASHVYLTHPESAATLRAFFPEARFVLILRHPADRAYSLYHHMRRYGYETVPTFEKALRKEEKRCRSGFFQKHCGQYFYNFLYFRSGLFGEQLQRYFDLYDRRRFHILTLAQLMKDPAAAFRRIFMHLDVDPEFQPQVKTFNKGLTSRSGWIQNLVNLKLRRPYRLRRAAMDLAGKLNIKPPPPMNPDTRRQLCRRYEPDLAKLYDLTGVRFD